jgi:hypothetical protein
MLRSSESSDASDELPLCDRRLEAFEGADLTLRCALRDVHSISRTRIRWTSGLWYNA